MLATVFAGAAMVAVLVLPSLSGQDMHLLPVAAAAGAVVAIPFALLVAKRILTMTAKGA